MNPSFGVNRMSNLNKPPFNLKIPDLIEPESPNNYNAYYTNGMATYKTDISDHPGVCVTQPENKKTKKGKFVNNINNNANINNANINNNDISYKSFPIVDTLTDQDTATESKLPSPVIEQNNTTEINEKPSSPLPQNTIDSPNTKSSYSRTNTNNILEHNWNNDYLVDPLSVIIKLSLLGKKEVNTKISIINNAVQIHEVGLFQGITRFYYNSNKFDIYYLHTPIKLACVHFLLNTKIEDMDSLRKLFHNAIYGLEKLNITYKSYAIIGLCLNSYIDIIKNSIKGTYNPTLYKEDDYSIYYTDEKINKMNSIWSTDKLQIVLNMNEYIYTDNKSNESIKSLETFMYGVDSDIQSILDTSMLL